MSMNKVINLHYLTLLTNTLEDTISFCKSIGLLPKEVNCPNCKKKLDKPYFVKRTKCDAHEIHYQCNKKCAGEEERGILCH